MATINEVVLLLQARDLKKRKEAMSILRDMKGERVHKLLAAVAQKDTDPELRQMALTLLREKDTQLAEQASKPRDPKDLAKSLPEAARKQAQNYVEAALSANMNGSNAAALKNLRKALELNPTLRHDGYYISILNTVTGLEGEDAFDAVKNATLSKKVAVDEAKLKAEAKRQQHIEAAQAFNWQSALFDLVIFALIAVVAPFLIMLTTQQALANLDLTTIDAQLVSEDTGAPVSAFAAQLLDLFGEAEAQQARFPFGTVIAVSLGFGAALIVTTLLQNVLIHVLSTRVMGGKGTFGYLTYKLVGLYNTRLPILMLILCLGVFVPLAAQMLLLGAVFGLAAVIFTLVVVFQSMGRVAQAYHYSPAMALVALMIANTVGGVVLLLVTSALAGTVLTAFFGS